MITDAVSTAGDAPDAQASTGAAHDQAHTHAAFRAALEGARKKGMGGGGHRDRSGLNDPDAIEDEPVERDLTSDSQADEAPSIGGGGGEVRGSWVDAGQTSAAGLTFGKAAGHTETKKAALSQAPAASLELAATAARADGHSTKAPAKISTPGTETPATQTLTGQSGMIATMAGTTATASNIDALSTLFDQALLAVQSDGEPVRLTFPDGGWPLANVVVAPMTDGSFAMTVTLSDMTFPEKALTDPLVKLRKRLEVKGVILSSLEVAAGKAGEPALRP